MRSDAQRQADYQSRQASKGRARLNCWIAAGTKKAISELAQQHGKSIADVIDLSVAAAKAMLAKRATETRPPCLIIRQQNLQKQPVAPSQPAADTDTPTAPENAPTAPQREPGQTSDDDARIRAAAFIVEP